MQIDPYPPSDPGQWGASLVTHAELVLALLDAVRARSVVEVGAHAGDLTRLLLEWAAESGARVHAIDPSPRPALTELAAAYPDLELIRATSHDALGEVPLPDAAVIDGDHNYYTVSEELRIIGERADGSRLPLLLLHDVGWPHARRDDYYAPELIPEEYRQPLREGGGLFPGERGIAPGGLPFSWSAEREGGPRNGVLTAVEDFVAQRDGLRLAVVPLFFGLAVVWDRAESWDGDVAAILAPWDRNPLLERLEANRVLHLAGRNAQNVKVDQLKERNRRQEHVLRKMLASRAFSLAERISRVRFRGAPPAFSKDEIRRALGD